MKDYSAGASNPTNCFARWLSEYLVLSASLELEANDLKPINPKWHGFICPKVFKGVPFDIEGFLYSCERILVELSRFSFPNESRKIVIESRVNSGVMQNLISVYCVQDGRQA